MNFNEFIQHVVDAGIAAARRDYYRPDQAQKLDGAVKGFEACRGKSITELRELLEAAQCSREAARGQDRTRYWWYRCYEAEVEWVCNVVSVMLHNQGLPVIVPPTVRAGMTAQKILEENRG